MILRPVTILLLLGALASPSLAQAQSWNDSLKGATDAASKEVNENVNDANAKVDEASAKAEAAKEAPPGAPGTMSDRAKRATGKGVQAATDSALGGATMTESAKSGGGAALKEAMGTARLRSRTANSKRGW